MSNDTVALSQDEVDKLLGLTSNSLKKIKTAKKSYKVQSFLTEQQLDQIKELCKSVYKFFKISLKNRFGEPKIRKLTISSLCEQNINEFFDSCTENDFLYEVKFGKAKAYIKLDSFLFSALSGLKIDAKQTVNRFQCEVLSDFVVKYLAEGFKRQLKGNSNCEILSLFEKSTKSYKKGKTGLCININWNENLHSFGIEKVFLTKELVESFRIFS